MMVDGVDHSLGFNAHVRRVSFNGTSYAFLVILSKGWNLGCHGHKDRDRLYTWSRLDGRAIKEDLNE